MFELMENRKIAGVLLFILLSVLVGCAPQKVGEEKDEHKDRVKVVVNESEVGEVDEGSGFSYLESDLMIEPIEDLSEDFIRGVDISTLIEMEALGQKYYGKDGAEQDLMIILKNHGINWIRVRLWNDPYDVSWSKELSSTGQIIEGAVGAGTNDLGVAIELSKRAKDAGIKVLLDYHYSDFWADPGKQYKPDSWRGLEGAELEKALYDYTYESLQSMAEANALPDMVQVGNEINGGLVWPDGRGVTSNGAFGLLDSGSKAVRAIAQDYDHPIKVMIHLAEGGDRRKFMEAFDAFTEKELDYDVIGLSFYSYWHGSLKELQLNLKMLEERYNKELVVVELAYANSYENSDITDNLFSEAMAIEGGYEATVQGQANYVRDIMSAVSKVQNNRGLGVFYWEPAWLTPEGAGWIRGAGNAWENQAMFSTDGHVLDSLQVFYAVYLEDTSVEPQYKNAEGVAYKIDQGQKVSLPYRINVLMTDDRYIEMTVKWDNIPLGYNETPGMYWVKGVIEDIDQEINASIEVIENHNVLSNGGFEEGLMNISMDGNVYKLGQEGENPFTGRYALNYWAPEDYEADMSYDTLEVVDGHYELSVFIMGSSLGDTNSYVYTRTADGEKRQSIDVSGFDDWKKVVINNISVKGGDFEFGIHLSEAGGSWGWIDDFQLNPIN